MRKWWIDPISIGRSIGNKCNLFSAADEPSDRPWVKVVAVADVLKALRTIKNTLEMSEDDPDECAIDEVHCLILKLEKEERR